MTGHLHYTFSAEVWKYSGTNGWYFVSLPLELSQEIRNSHQWQEEGWGRLKAVARIGNTEWKTAIWFDTKQQTYLLPLKAQVRKNEGIRIGRMMEVSVRI